MRRIVIREIVMRESEIEAAAGWITDDDDEILRFHVVPHTLAPDDAWAGRETPTDGDRYAGISIQMSFDRYIDVESDELLDPILIVERDPRDPSVNGGDRYDYACVEVGVIDAEDARAILATPATEVIEKLRPALEWLRVAPTQLRNLGRSRSGVRPVRLFG